MKAFRLMLGVGLMFVTLGSSAHAVTTNLFSTQFEASESYSSSLDLAGQQGWAKEGSGGNGVVVSGLQGQSAYIGFAPPNLVDDSLVLWRPINVNPVVAGFPLVKFSVLLNIIDSSNGRYDIFRWSVYNQQLNRLFSIDFDNDYLDVSYRLDGTNSTFFTNIPITNNSNYLMQVTMNFAANRWSATLNNVLIATNQPMTTVNASLTLADIDAVWLVNQVGFTNTQGQVNYTNAPGNNYLLFDNYQITAESIVIPPTQVRFLGRTTEGWGLLRVTGAEGGRWAVEGTTNFVNWTALKTNQISGGSFDFVDTTSGGLARRYYRARYVP